MKIIVHERADWATNNISWCPVEREELDHDRCSSRINSPSADKALPFSDHERPLGVPSHYILVMTTVSQSLSARENAMEHCDHFLEPFFVRYRRSTLGSRFKNDLSSAFHSLAAPA